MTGGAADRRIETARRGHVFLVTINRPEARNAVDIDMAWAICAAMDELEADADLRIAILTGAQGCFSAGADLKAAAIGASRPLPPRGNFGMCVRPPQKPVIAAIEGYAVGGGFELALTCDLIVAARDAQFGLPEVQRGLVAAAGGAFRLPQRLPYHLAMEMALTGNLRTAEYLHGFGLVNRLTDSGGALAEAFALAKEIEANGPLAVAATARIVRAAGQCTDQEAFAAQIPILQKVRQSNDRVEGLKAFAEKRPPNWTGA